MRTASPIAEGPACADLARNGRYTFLLLLAFINTCELILRRNSESEHRSKLRTICIEVDACGNLKPAGDGIAALVIFKAREGLGNTLLRRPAPRFTARMISGATFGCLKAKGTSERH